MAGKSNIKGLLQSQEPNPRVMRYMVPVNPFKEEPDQDNEEEEDPQKGVYHLMHGYTSTTREKCKWLNDLVPSTDIAPLQYLFKAGVFVEKTLVLGLEVPSYTSLMGVCTGTRRILDQLDVCHATSSVEDRCSFQISKSGSVLQRYRRYFCHEVRYLVNPRQYYIPVKTHRLTQSSSAASVASSITQEGKDQEIFGDSS